MSYLCDDLGVLGTTRTGSGVDAPLGVTFPAAGVVLLVYDDVLCRCGVESYRENLWLATSADDSNRLEDTSRPLLQIRPQITG